MINIPLIISVIVDGNYSLVQGVLLDRSSSSSSWRASLCCQLALVVARDETGSLLSTWGGHFTVEVALRSTPRTTWRRCCGWHYQYSFSNNGGLVAPRFGFGPRMQHPSPLAFWPTLFESQQLTRGKDVKGQRTWMSYSISFCDFSTLAFSLPRAWSRLDQLYTSTCCKKR